MDLMDAGFIMKKDQFPGIAIGINFDGTAMLVLSDILVMKNHLGDMDFKVIRSSEGITCLSKFGYPKIKGLSL